ncbi:AMP-binding protein [Ekhidna sp.]|uniref:AMP-binding protein n=1 Tax=Ekhidna sp. TaxID=2608089 RepID=UPI003518BA43
MIIYSKNFRLKLEEILKEELPTETYNDTEKNVLKIVRNWHSDKSYFFHQTSGSTGAPKQIEISREKIKYSSQATMSFIGSKATINNSLLCINPEFIGGAMVIYRALIYDLDIHIVEPETDFMTHLDSESKFDLVSVVPMQFEKLTQDQISRFKVILIGGAPMPIKNESYRAQVFSTFGMTETVSHIALRPLSDEIFTATGDTEIAIEKDHSLKIKGTITDHKWLKTNDLIELISNKSFKWLGRKDFIINSGGIKLNPETIEQSLQDQIEGDFMVGSMADEKLGRKVILLLEQDHKLIDFSRLETYQKPKEVFFNQRIFKTASNKIDRLKTQEFFEASL